MSEGLFSAVELGTSSRAGYRLKRLEVFNWGTFDGRVWRLEPDAQTALLTGDIGSGKSTLVDALTTLLLPAHRIAYNKAAGADSRERTLRSYVEGHYKSERSETSGRSRQVGLRSGSRTYSVVLGVFCNDGHDETVTLAQVFQQRDSAGQPYRFFVTTDKELSIAADFADFGSDLRDLRKRLRSAGAGLFDEFPKYATSLRRLLGVRSEQALELFHQTVSMKSVGNLNDFVREHMLEPSDAADRVRSIIAHFDDLTKAHDAVRRAREQLEALQPIVDAAAKYDAALHERSNLERQRAAVSIFTAELRSQLLAQEIAALRTTEEQLVRELAEATAVQRQLADERDALIEERARAGGDRIGELERLVRESGEQVDRRTRDRARFDDIVISADLTPVTDGVQFAALAAGLPNRREQLATQRRALDAQITDAYVAQKAAESRTAEVGAELESLRNRTSNLPPAQVDIREQICVDLHLSPQQLPYAGELLDVREEHSQWRGAAERVLRGFALTLLVSAEHYETVTSWVNANRLVFRGRGGRQIGAKLVYERVAARRVPSSRLEHDGLLLADCLQVKESAFGDYLSEQLYRRADHRCAQTLAEFRSESKAVTREGQVRSGSRHEKDDRHQIDDPRQWVLGWANERKMEVLAAELAELEAERDRQAAALDTLSADKDRLHSRQEAVARLESFDSWIDLDVQQAHSQRTELEQELIRLQAGSTRLTEITQALARNDERRGAAAGQLSELTGRQATNTAAIGQAVDDKQRYDRQVRDHPAAEVAAAREEYPALRTRLGSAVPTKSSAVSEVQSQLGATLHEQIESRSKELTRLAQTLAQHMSEVLRRWPELQADMDADVDARGDFLAFRDQVANDDLPRFEDEFKEQLNKNAIQELAGFNNWLNRQAAGIGERVARINEALGAVPYNPGRYIRLEREPTPNQDISTFRSDLRNLTNDSLVVDGDQYSEQRFLDVKRIIERFRGRDGHAETDRGWTARVTDVRNWFVFSASERDLVTGEEWEHYSDSDGKSGGQKEKLAYTILAASLAYQFGLEWGATKSKDFRFAVIDEAFGRGSDVSTRYALELFAKLGLQLLIVTPLQKVHVIEPYVKAIGFVDNPAGTSSRLYTMTIEDYRAKRDRSDT